MKQLNAYLTFDGNCRQAMEFYASCFGAELQMFPFSEMPGDIPEADKNRIMHATLTKGSQVLMASDSMPGMPFQQGSNFSLSLHLDNNEEQDRLFAALGENGQVKMPVQDVFWGSRFGMLTDQFGINWMFSVEKGQG